MKKLTGMALAAGALALLGSREAAAQSNSGQPEWGRWQLVSNTHTPRSTTVQFYTASGELMYQERVEGRRLNPGRRKVARQLDNTLAAAYQGWVKNKSMAAAQKDLFAKSRRAKTADCSYTARQ